MITATVHYTLEGLTRQRSFTAETEEQLLTTIFMWRTSHHGVKVEIKQVQYRGKLLRWNDFIADNHFAKGRLSFEEFKTLCTTAKMSLVRCN